MFLVNIRYIRAVYNKEQKKAGQPLAVEVKKRENYFEAEEYPQGYLYKKPGGYCHIPRQFMPG